MNFTVDSQIFNKTPDFKIGFCEIADVKVRASQEKFLKLLAEEEIRTREYFTTHEIAEDPHIKGMRKLYKSWGTDPARYRPSAERLIRRVKKGDNLYHINTVVETCNLVSMQIKLPIGLYDCNKVKGDMVLRYGKEGERYLGITGIDIGAEGKVMVFDDEGPIGSATTDSRRTAIDETTSSFVCLIYGPENIGEEYVRESLDKYFEILSGLQDASPRIVHSTILQSSGVTQ